MKKHILKNVHLLTVFCLLLGSFLMIVPTAEAAVRIPYGYSQVPSGTIALKPGDYYKELSGFEGEGIRASDIANTGNLQLSYSSENVINGTKNGRWTFSSGADNDVKITCFIKTDNVYYMDWSDAAYWQFYVDNSSNTTKLQLGNMTIAAYGELIPIASGIQVEFYNTVDGTWSELTTKSMYNTIYKGIEIAAGEKGFVRIPLNSTVYPGLTTAKLLTVDRTLIYAQMPGCLANSKAYFDDYGIIATDSTLPADKDRTGVYNENAVVSSSYTNNPSNIVLKENEYFKLITGFEDFGFRAVGANQSYSILNPNNGVKSGKYTFTSIDKNNGIVNSTVENTNANARDLSRAKYLQFYVYNTTDAPLQFGLMRFCYKIGTANEVNMDMTAGREIEFYDLSLNQWVILKSHKMNQPSYFGIELPIGARGFVRIPLNSDTYPGLTKEMIQNYTRTVFFVQKPSGSVTANNTAYIDDFGMVADGSTFGLRGDVNEDGIKDITDMILLKNNLLNKVTLAKRQLELVYATDAAKITDLLWLKDEILNG